jgi:hypothetical protein
MAKFCTKCGSPLAEDVQFCTNCGAAFGAPIAAPPAAPAPPTPRASAAPAATAGAAGPAAAAAPAAKAGSPIVKIILIVVGVLILLTAVGIGSCVYIAYRIKQRGSAIMHGVTSGRTSFGTPELQIEKGGAGSEAEEVATMDVPPYPGSTATEGGGSLGAAGFGIAAQEYETSDSVDQVVAFYKEKLGNKLSIHESGGNAVLQIKTGANAMTTITLSRGEGAGRTKINIMRIGK